MSRKMKGWSAFVLLFQFLFLVETKAQSMKAIEILQNLIPYEELLNELQEREMHRLGEKEGSMSFEKNISSSYSFITLELYRIQKNQDEKAPEKRLCCQVRFELAGELPKLNDVYHVTFRRRPPILARGDQRQSWSH